LKKCVQLVNIFQSAKTYGKGFKISLCMKKVDTFSSIYNTNDKLIHVGKVQLAMLPLSKRKFFLGNEVQFSPSYFRVFCLVVKRSGRIR
jgi:hypothetical protein